MKKQKKQKGVRKGEDYYFIYSLFHFLITPNLSIILPPFHQP